MTLRLVLVSLVAALGITLPGTPMVDNWVVSTQKWVTTRFADWDARDLRSVRDEVPLRGLAHQNNPQASPEATIPTLVVSESDQGHPLVLSHVKAIDIDARAMISPAGVLHTVSFARHLQSPETGWQSKDGVFEISNGTTLLSHAVKVPLSVDDPKPSTPVTRVEPYRVIDETSQLFYASLVEGIEKAAGAVKEPRPEVVSIEGLALFEDLYGGAWYRSEAEQAAEAEHVEEAAPPLEEKPAEPAIVASTEPTPADTASLGFGAMEASETLYFDGDRIDSALVVATEPMIFAPEKIEALKASEPVEPTQVADAQPVAPVSPEPAVAQEECWFVGESVFAPSEAAPMTAVEATRPAFEPILVDGELYVGVVYELNRRNDGSPALNGKSNAATNLASETMAPADIQKNEAEPVRQDLSRAVKLTRDAAYAWINLFTSPALVTVTNRN